ncbi:hypothetical protein MKW92_043598 [Papaver armeniacum]|nr:hypothetical protein MKW92_043598 [Papaver armeniacum]
METKSDDLPIILTLRKFPFIPSFDEQFSRKFTTLKKSDPLIPLNEFLTTHCQSVKALICVGGGGGTPVQIETPNCLPSLGCILTDSAGLDHIDLVE